MNYSIAPTLLTPRLSLRPYRLADFESFAALYASPRSKFAYGPVSKEVAWTWFAAGAGRWSLVGYGSWAIECRKDDACVGIVSLNHPIGPNTERELGWLLWDGFEGAGYATEAATEAKRFAFDDLAWKALVSYIDKDNVQSINLAGRLGSELDDIATKQADERTLVYRHRP